MKSVQPVDVGRSPTVPPAGDAMPAPAAPARRSRPRPGDRHLALVLASVAVVALGVVLRFWARSELWLDEALSVSIARLPLSELPDALRQDGAPPLYYALLHAWIGVFGEGNGAVRALSGLFSVASLPLAWVLGQRLGGRPGAVAALLVLASSPFAIRYGSETRMYSFVIFLVFLGHLALLRALDRPRLGRLALLALVTGALLLTHYWSMYLLAVTGAALLWRWRKGSAAESRAAFRCLAAMAAGSLALVPWLPVLAFQAAHTGTPWAGKPAPAAAVDIIRHFALAHTDAGAVLSLLYPALHVIAVFGRPPSTRRLELDLLPSGPALGLLVASLGTVLLGVVLGQLTGSAFAPRYASVALAPFVLLSAMGILLVNGRRLMAGLLAVTVALGLFAAWSERNAPRTQAGRVAARLAALGRPGDVVAYCPDQLGPAASRLLPGGRYQQRTYPDGGSPRRVDWTDYEQRNEAGRPDVFARYLLRLAGPERQVFVVWAGGYRTFGGDCERLLAELRRFRTSVQRERGSGRFGEGMTLVQVPAVTP